MQCPTEETCFHCGVVGHRLARCPVKDVEMNGGGGIKGGNVGGSGKGFKFDKSFGKGGGKGKESYPHVKGGKGGKGYQSKGSPTWYVWVGLGFFGFWFLVLVMFLVLILILILVLVLFLVLVFVGNIAQLCAMRGCTHRVPTQMRELFAHAT